MKTLGIDYGEKYFGLAISDDRGKFAQAINTIVTRKQRVALKKLAALIDAESVGRIVLGLPLGFEDKPTQKSEEVEEFTLLLKQITDAEIVLWNEVLTSKLAEQNITHHSQIHSEAARIMLQEFLDNEYYESQK